MKSQTTSHIGNHTHCDFYLTGNLAFRVAYKMAKQSKNNKELCAHVGSMMCAVSEGLRSYVETALKRLGIWPRVVSLPSGAEKLNINVDEVTKMDWPTILVIFGCCILLLFEHHTDEESYKTHMSNRIRELQGRVGYDPASADLDVPFDFTRAKAIRTMLGASSTLREALVRYMMGNIMYVDSGAGSVCQYLFSVLSWSGMYEFTVMTKVLVKPQSPVLNDPSVSSEVENLIEACEAVSSHPHPQFFMHLASLAEQLKVDCSRFPNLFVVAQELDRGGNGSSIANSVITSMPGVKLTTVQALVKLHREAMRPCP